MDKKIMENANITTRSLGPAAYSVKPTIGQNATDPTIERNPAYSIPGKRVSITRAGHPGPEYDTSGFTEHGRHRTSGGVIGRRTGGRAAAATPGPADYCARTARTSVGVRMVRPAGGARDPWKSPAPNAYKMPDASRGPRPRMLGRWADRDAKCAYPGPGQYDAPHADVYLPGASRVGRSMAGRPADVKKRDACDPGPADYDGGARVNCCKRDRAAAEDCLKQPCRVTFGVRRPDAVGVFAVPRDNEYGCR